LVITNADLSSVIISMLLILLAVAVRLNLTNNHRPQGLQNAAEWVMESLYNLTQSVTNSRVKTHTFFPLIAGFFLFILVNNWVSILPGVGTIGINRPASQLHGNEQTVFVPLFRAASADLNFTLALALLSVGLTQVFGIKYVGLSYFKKFVNFSNPIMFFVGLLEIISEVAKVLSFAFRLFGNIFAGEVLLAVTLFLMPLIVPLPFYGLEVFVGFIQALVFTMLSLVFFNMATLSHEH